MFGWVALAEPTCAAAAAATAGGGIFSKPSKTHPWGSFGSPTAALLFFIMSPVFSAANEPYTLRHGTVRIPCLKYAVCFKEYLVLLCEPLPCWSTVSCCCLQVEQRLHRPSCCIRVRALASMPSSHAVLCFPLKAVKYESPVALSGDIMCFAALALTHVMYS